MSTSNTASPKTKAVLTVGALGVVFGDIGTSPIYALRESLVHAAAGGLSREEVLGTVSLLLWALIIIATLKYIVLIMRADNKGEGGTLSLVALAQKGAGKRSGLIFFLGVLGGALFYGDSVITPAISVLSAIEGLALISPRAQQVVLPLSVFILFALFAVQSRGTAKVSSYFGPIMAVWFVAIGVIGAIHVFDDISIFKAFNPYYAVTFLYEHGLLGFVVMGSVFLAVTGAEATYADMGHFGKGPIRLGWLAFVLPSLALNYLGQGSFVLSHQNGFENPFFQMVPENLLPGLVLLATIAAIIASQAVITGAYSLTQQAVQLGMLPRFDIRFTSETNVGQIYIPAVNQLLLVGVLVLVFAFRSSSALSSAYGIAVTGTMLVSTCLLAIVAIKVWKWRWPLALMTILPFAIIETAFMVANGLKFFDGGWASLALALALVVVMVTWVRGTSIVAAKTRRETLPLHALLSSLHKTLRVPGTAIFLTSEPESAPHALLHNLKHNKVLHERNIILSVRTVMQPRVADDERMDVRQLSDDFWRVILTFGYMETPNVPRALGQCKKLGVTFDIMSTSFFLGRRTFKMSRHPLMWRWQEKLYFWLTKSAANATEYFGIPAGRVVEMGAQMLI